MGPQISDSKNSKDKSKTVLFDINCQIKITDILCSSDKIKYIFKHVKMEVISKFTLAAQSNLL